MPAALPLAETFAMELKLMIHVMLFFSLPNLELTSQLKSRSLIEKRGKNKKLTVKLASTKRHAEMSFQFSEYRFSSCMLCLGKIHSGLG